MKILKGSIQKRLMAIIFFVVFLTSGIGYAAFLYWHMSNQQDRVLNLSNSVGMVLSQDFAKLILLNQLDVASDITTKLRSFERLEYLTLYGGHNQEPIYHYNKEFKTKQVTPLPLKNEIKNSINNGIATIFQEALYEGIYLGDVKFTFKVDRVVDVIKRDLNMLFVIIVLLFFLSYFLSSLFARKFTLPVLNLVAFLEEVGLETLYKKRVVVDDIDRDNEYGKLYNEVNTMLERIEQAQKAQKLAAVAFETPSGMLITDKNQTILMVNRAFSEITGYSSDEVIGKTPAILNSKKHPKEFYENMYYSLEKNRFWRGEIFNRHKNGSLYPEQLTIQSVLNDNKEVIYYVAAFLDLTIQKEALAKVEYLSRHDPITGLANREMLCEEIDKHLRLNRQKGVGALFCFDFNNFKIVNDTLGHSIGDLLLQEVAKRLKKEFGASDLIARLDADEFVLWFSYIKDDLKDAILKAELIAENLTDSLSSPYILETKEVHSIPSVGIELYSSGETNSKTLLKNVDSALHQAKMKQEKNIAFFDKEAQTIAKENLELYSELLQGVQKNQFVLLYQPQYSDDNRIYGAEALIRWNHPSRGFLTPFHFIDLAERSGVIFQIGLWVLNSACNQLALWQKEERCKEWIMAVNVSAKQFNQDKFIDQVKDVLQKSGANPLKLKLELTESILVDNIDKVVSKMSELRELGISISLDDFGTGYSSLQYLKLLPLNQVKIDRSFVKDMEKKDSDRAIIKSIISLGEAFGFEVIAEGVETREQYEHLRELGCSLFQGYYFSRPISADKI